MAEYERNAVRSDDWYTPPEIFDALGLQFDLDPCSPGPGHWVPAKLVYTKADDGLKQRWRGRVFVNPPFGGRHSHLPWLERFLVHGDGIAICRAYTSADWFHEYATRADAMLFPRGKTKFIRPDGSVGKAPGHGVVLLAMGAECCAALKQSGLGFYAEPTP
jgi:DNA N-6-adenine-methyltransferase (Dam)